MSEYDYTGFESAFVPTPPSPASDRVAPNVEVKTTSKKDKAVADPGTRIINQGKGSNVLNSYRSYTYQFTLSALRREDAADPKKYRKSEQELVILKSGGKGYAGLTYTTAQASEDALKTLSKKTKTEEQAKSQIDAAVTTLGAPDLVGGFNKNSPGRFDMFLDNVEIETMMAFSENGGTTQPTSINFDVFEPFSINGFIEALHVSAVAAGFPSYAGAPFLLKMEFIGYPDGEDMPKAKIVDKATRYFPMLITGIDVTVNETGTRYKLTAVGYNEGGFGNPSQLKKPVKMAGNTVKDILENLMIGVNKQIVEADDLARKKKSAANEHDEYKIKFPVWKDNEGFVDGLNDIGGAKVTEILKDNALYKFPDPGTTTKPTTQQTRGQQNPTPEQNQKRPEFYKLEPGNPVVQFAEGKNLHECIASVIRDSKYIRNIVEKLASPEWKTVVDSNGMVDYFLIRMEVENKEVIDDEAQRPYQIYTYVITQHKIMYTRIPNYGSEQLDMTKIAPLSLREYNYIYTGKNVDVLNFKLNFNTLFFEAIPQALGNNNSPPARDAAAKSNETKPRSAVDETTKQNVTARGLPAVPRKPDPFLTGVGAQDNGGQRQDDAYYALAKGMHEAIVNSKGSMLTGEIEILGDPYYLVTGGIGNYNPTPSKNSPRETDDGEAAFNYGEVLITIYFRNPQDLDPLEKGGRLRFDPELIPFSGVYRVNKAKSMFKDGIFKQSLEIMRTPGQPPAEQYPTPGGVNKPTNPSRRLVAEVNKADAVSVDASPVTQEVVNVDTGQSGNRADSFNLLGQLNRGLPSPGLPGEYSNFTAATGGLGGSISPLPLGGLTGSPPPLQVSGATPNLVGQSRLATQVFGGVVPGGINQSSQGIRMPARAVPGLQGRVLSPTGLVTEVGRTIANSFGLTGVARQVAEDIVGIATQKINRIGVLGSGIGVGVNVPYTPQTTQPASVYEERSRQNVIPPTAIPTTGIAAGLDQSTLASVANLKSADVSNLINNVGTNIRSATQGASSDPTAIASSFGINQSQLSGLSPNLQSKILDQVSSIGENIPKDTNVTTLSAQGVNLSSFTKDQLSNLPPTVPYSVAPQAAPDAGFLNQLTQKGGPAALAKAFGVNSVSEISQGQVPSQTVNTAISNAPTAYQNPLRTTSLEPNLVDTVAGAAKYLLSNSQIAGLTGVLGSREGDLLRLANRYPGSPVNVNLGGGTPNVVSRFGSKTSGNSPLDKIMLR